MTVVPSRHLFKQIDDFTNVDYCSICGHSIRSEVHRVEVTFMGQRDKGIYDKFHVERKDGESEIGGKHERCRYFVLDLDHDRHAIPAIEAYAKSAHLDGYDMLARDLFALVEALRIGQSYGEEIERSNAAPAVARKGDGWLDTSTTPPTNRVFDGEKWVEAACGTCRSDPEYRHGRPWAVCPECGQK